MILWMDRLPGSPWPRPAAGGQASSEIGPLALQVDILHHPSCKIDKGTMDQKDRMGRRWFFGCHFLVRPCHVSTHSREKEGPACGCTGVGAVGNSESGCRGRRTAGCNCGCFWRCTDASRGRSVGAAGSGRMGRRAVAILCGKHKSGGSGCPYRPQTGCKRECRAVRRCDQENQTAGSRSHVDWRGRRRDPRHSGSGR